MDLKALRWQIRRGSLARRLVGKFVLFATAMVVLSFMQIANEIRGREPVMLDFNECALNVGSDPNLNHFSEGSDSNSLESKSFDFLRPLSSLLTPFKGNDNATVGVFEELMKMEMLDHNARILCVGEDSDLAVSALRELGFSNARGVERHPFFSLFKKHFVYELEFEDSHFDFVFSRALDKVSVPALLVREIERVLRPGGTGAMLVGASNFRSGSLVRSATPVTLFLKHSNVLHVCGMGSYTLVIFKKRLDNARFIERYKLPNECPSIANKQPFMQYIEPLVDRRPDLFEAKVSYLPKYMNVSSRNRLIYINVGAGDLVDSSIVNALKPNYPFKPQAFHVYVVDHNPSALSSYVKNPGITFVYHPGLVGDNNVAPIISYDDYWSAPLDEEEFEFIRWFKETIQDGDFVALMMNARESELRVIFELFESGAICNVDELFLRCSDGVDCKSGSCSDCKSLFTGLRNAGVFVHQWWGD